MTSTAGIQPGCAGEAVVKVGVSPKRRRTNSGTRSTSLMGESEPKGDGPGRRVSIDMETSGAWGASR
ncbi:MAG: hypothetical protein MUF21_13750 [Gemmatimonadaceae bacterium]|nr:hypothetical protein [Gemmatimonadaceae bacterium]